MFWAIQTTLRNDNILSLTAWMDLQEMRSTENLLACKNDMRFALSILELPYVLWIFVRYLEPW